MLLTEKKQDILGDILNRNDDYQLSEVEELTTLIRCYMEPPTTPNKRKKKIRQKKTTHYLAIDIFDNLGDTKERIRSLLPSVPKSKISKSRIVNYALMYILNEFKKNREDSTLIRQVLHQGNSTTHI